jgi:hypothetical protein
MQFTRNTPFCFEKMVSPDIQRYLIERVNATKSNGETGPFCLPLASDCTLQCVDQFGNIFISDTFVKQGGFQ